MIYQQNLINNIPITKGGTGAATAEEALTNLGAIAKPDTCAEGNLISFDANGNAVDSGKSVEDINFKTYNSILKIFTSEEITQAIVTDFNTSIVNILTALPNNSILSFNTHSTSYPDLMNFISQKINTDCGTNYSTTASYITLIIKKWTNNTMPIEVEVIYDNGNCKYKCICETDSGNWVVSNFSETFNPRVNFVKSSIPMTLSVTEEGTLRITYDNGL